MQVAPGLACRGRRGGGPGTLGAAEGGSGGAGGSRWGGGWEWLRGGLRAGGGRPFHHALDDVATSDRITARQPYLLRSGRARNCGSWRRRARAAGLLPGSRLSFSFPAAGPTPRARHPAAKLPQELPRRRARQLDVRGQGGRGGRGRWRTGSSGGSGATRAAALPTLPLLPLPPEHAPAAAADRDQHDGPGQQVQHERVPDAGPQLPPGGRQEVAGGRGVGEEGRGKSGGGRLGGGAVAATTTTAPTTTTTTTAPTTRRRPSHQCGLPRRPHRGQGGLVPAHGWDKHIGRPSSQLGRRPAGTGPVGGGGERVGGPQHKLFFFFFFFFVN